jgi:hypothetical protein
MKRLSQLFFALGVCGAMASYQASAAAFKNGSFELPGIGSTDRIALGAGEVLPGWFSVGNTAGEAVFYQGSGFMGFAARDGVATLGFGGSGAAGGSIRQTFDTVVGATYKLTYFTSAQQAGSGAQSFLAEAISGNNVTLAAQADVIPAVNNAWLEHTLSFVTTTSMTELRFTDTSNGAAANGINWALDAVSVTPAISVTPVPEPSTYALMLAGLAATAGLARKKSAQRKPS